MFSAITTLLSGKEKVVASWEVLLFIKRTFLHGDVITIPSNKVLTMHSAQLNGEIVIDGEAYLQ